MKFSLKAEEILGKINSKTKLGDLRKIAKEIKKDHQLSLELWSSKNFLARLLGILIMDHKLLSEEQIDELVENMNSHSYDERNQLMDWFMANQLTKNKKNIALMESWKDSPLSLQRRTFWYYQGRQRWMGKTPPDNTAELLNAIENNIEKEEPEVQWAMNFVAGWIGVFDIDYRARCVKIGEETGLYKGEMVSKGCTPNYLPEFIAIEADKRNI